MKSEKIMESLPFVLAFLMIILFVYSFSLTGLSIHSLVAYLSILVFLNIGLIFKNRHKIEEVTNHAR